MPAVPEPTDVVAKVVRRNVSGWDLPPASAPVKPASSKQKNDDYDNNKGGRVHVSDPDGRAPASLFLAINCAGPLLLPATTQSCVQSVPEHSRIGAEIDTLPGSEKNSAAAKTNVADARVATCRGAKKSRMD
jgi:hypothetical protein